MAKIFDFKSKNDIFSDIEKAQVKAKSTYTAKEIVKMSRGIITKALTKKCLNFKDIAEYFNKHGCDITADELEKEYNIINKRIKLSKPNPANKDEHNQHLGLAHNSSATSASINALNENAKTSNDDTSKVTK